MSRKVLQTRHPIVTPMVRHRHMCLECDLCELISYYKRDYALAFCEGFQSSYDRARGERIAQRLAVRTSEQMYAKYDLSFLKREVQDVWDYNAFLHRKIDQNQPVIVHFDSFYAEWDPFFGKEHNNHTLLVSGYDENMIYLSDAYFGIVRWVPQEMFLKASNFYYQVEAEDIARLPQGWHRPAFEQLKEELCCGNYWQEMENFSKDLAEIEYQFECADEPFGPPERTSEILKITDRMELNKHRFHLFLREWESLEGHMRYGACYENVLTGWRVFRASLFKARCRKCPKDMLLKVSEYFCRLMGTEKEFFEKMICNLHPQEPCSRLKVHDISIEKLCNNKGLSRRADDRAADCTGLEEFIYVGNTEREIMRHGYRLCVDREHDNITCEGQFFEVPEGEWEQIAFLISAEWGSFPVTFRLKYKDGSEQTASAYIQDWTTEGEGRIPLGRSYVRENGEIRINNEMVYADEVVVPIEPLKYLDSLLLPDCPNVHIFAAKLKEKEPQND